MLWYKINTHLETKAWRKRNQRALVLWCKWLLEFFILHFSVFPNTVRTPPIWESQVIKANLDETGNDAVGSNVCHLKAGPWGPLGPGTCVLIPTPQPALTCEGVVTLISGTKLSSKKLMMFSCWSSFVGVTLGRGGTGGPFLVYKTSETQAN